jgi:hypothetical protein
MRSETDAQRSLSAMQRSENAKSLLGGYFSRESPDLRTPFPTQIRILQLPSAPPTKYDPNPLARTDSLSGSLSRVAPREASR